jgi:hypothetical protein
MYGTRTTTTNVLYQQQVNILKISRWSVRQKGFSLQQALESSGPIVAYLHYPQLRTTYVALKATHPATQHAGGSALGGRVAVESIPDRSIFEKEEELAAPETTACITSDSQFSEADIFAELQKYGSVRALLFTYSAGSRERTCRASFYEAYSVDQLLRTQPRASRTLRRGLEVRIERAGPCAPLHSSLAQASKQAPAAVVSGSRPADTKQMHGVGAETGRSSAAGAPVRSLSQGASRPSHRFVRVFRDERLQVENSLQIIRSRLNERRCFGEEAGTNRAGPGARARSRSVDFPKRESREAVLLEFSSGAFAAAKDTGVCPVHSFALSELFFLRIQNPRDRPSGHCGFPQPGAGSRPEEKWSRESYLSQDDLSDGYSAQEMYFPPQTRSGRAAVDIKHEASDLQKTKHSSDSEQSCDKRTKLASPQASYFHKNQFSLIQPHCDYRQMDALQPRSLHYYFYPDRVFSTS